MNEQGHRTVSGEPRSQKMVNKKEREVAEEEEWWGERGDRVPVWAWEGPGCFCKEMGVAHWRMYGVEWGEMYSPFSSGDFPWALEHFSKES